MAGTLTTEPSSHPSVQILDQVDCYKSFRHVCTLKRLGNQRTKKIAFQLVLIILSRTGNDLILNK